MTSQTNNTIATDASLAGAGYTNTSISTNNSNVYINNPYTYPYPYTSPYTTPYITTPGTIKQPTITFPTTGTGMYYPYPGGTGNITIGSSIQTAKYHVMMLSVKRIPSLVYVCGRLVTFGILGSEAECAYAGNGKLVFTSSTINSIVYSNKRTISLQYKTKIYHYIIDNYNSNDISLNCKLLSEVSFK